MATLLDYLAEAASSPWSYGSMDCCLFGCDWVLRATGHDPAARYRGHYKTVLGALRLIKRAGGFVGIVSAEFDRLFQRTAEPKDGDVGIIEAPVGLSPGASVTGHLMAIRSGPRWVGRTSFGLHASGYPCAMAWCINA